MNLGWKTLPNISNLNLGHLMFGMAFQIREDYVFICADSSEFNLFHERSKSFNKIKTNLKSYYSELCGVRPRYLSGKNKVSFVNHGLLNVLDLITMEVEETLFFPDKYRGLTPHSSE